MLPNDSISSKQLGPVALSIPVFPLTLMYQHNLSCIRNTEGNLYDAQGGFTGSSGDSVEPRFDSKFHFYGKFGIHMIN